MSQTKSSIFRNAKVKRWYNVKGPKDIRWVAHQLTDEQRASLLPGFKYRGPFKSLLVCLIQSSS